MHSIMHAQASPCGSNGTVEFFTCSTVSILHAKFVSAPPWYLCSALAVACTLKNGLPILFELTLLPLLPGHRLPVTAAS